MQARGHSTTAALVALLVLAALAVASEPAVGRTVAGGIAGADPADDFLVDCDPNATPRAGVAAMDLMGARALGPQDGAEVFEVDTHGDASAYFSSDPPSASFVITLVTAPGGPRYNLVREIHEGQRRSVVERDGAPFPDATLLVDRREGGAPRFSVTGIPDLGTASRWGITAFVLPDLDSPRVCDRLGLDADGNPTLLLRAALTGSTTNRHAPGSARGNTDLPDWAWWLIALFSLLGLGLFAWWVLTKLRSLRPPAGGAHQAPPTPPPGANDFGK